MKIGIVYDTIHGSTYEACRYLKEALDKDFEVEILRAGEVNQCEEIKYFVVVSPIYGGTPLLSIANFIQQQKERWSDMLALIIVCALHQQFGEKYILNFIQTIGFNPLVKEVLPGVFDMSKIPEDLHKYLVENFMEAKSVIEKNNIYGKIDKTKCLEIAKKISETIENLELSKQGQKEEFKKGLEKFFITRFNAQASRGKKIIVKFIVEDLGLNYYVIADNGNLIFSEEAESPDFVFKAPSIVFNQINLGLADGTAMREAGLLEFEGDENLLYDLYFIFSIT